MDHFVANLINSGMLLPIVVGGLAMFIPIVAIITEYYQKRNKMRLMEKAIEHGANLEEFDLREPEDDPRRRMPYRGGMVTSATGAGILVSTKFVDFGGSGEREFNSFLFIGGIIVICVGVALLVNDFMNRERFERE